MLGKTVKELSLHTSRYFLATAASALASVVLLPVYTRILSRSDFGILEMVDSTRDVISIVLLAGFVPTTAKFYQKAVSPDERKSVISTSLIFIFASSLIWVAILLGFSQPLSRLLFGSVELVFYVYLMIAILFLDSIFLGSVNYLNIRKKSGLFLGVSWTKLVVNVGGNLYFLLVLGLGVAGMMFGELMSLAIVGTGILAYVLKDNGFRLRRDLLAAMLKFGWPFIPNGLAAALMHRVDRYLVQEFVGLSAVGIYGVGYRFPSMLNFLLLASFGRIWYSAGLYEVAQQDDYSRTTAKVATYFVSLYVVLQFALAVLAPTVMRVLATSEYFDAWMVMQVVALGYCLYSIHPFFTAGAFIKEKTWYLPISHIIPALLNIGLNWVLVPRFGYLAAAWVTVVTYFAYSALNYVIFQRFYPVTFEFRRLSLLLSVAVGLVLISNAWMIESVLLEGAKEFMFAAAFLIYVLFGPYLEREEKEAVRDELEKLSPRIALIFSKYALR